MRLPNNTHLAYCTNVHPGKDWQQTFHSLQNEVLAVRKNVCPDDEYAIGLRLSASAAQELSQPGTLTAFKRWLDNNRCYVFTINGFPFGDFHNTRVKEQAYAPDWTTPERLEYTKQLFTLLTHLLPSGVAGSVSTVPGSYKAFIKTPEQTQAIHQNLYQLFLHVEALAEKSGHDLHLGLEPEPLCLFETSDETLTFFDQFLDGRPDAYRIRQRIGVNYDTCHLALQYEDAPQSLSKFQAEHIRISKIHLSSALKVTDLSTSTLQILDTYCEPTYLHQVLTRNPETGDRDSSSQISSRFADLPDALAARRSGQDRSHEWRIHFHIPLHSEPAAPLQSTVDHLIDTLDHLSKYPDLCQHLEMETYTWAVLPGQLHTRSVVDQVTSEYQWLLPQLKKLGLK